MPVLELPASLRVHTRQGRVRVHGATLGEALQALVGRFPGVEPLIFTSAGELKRTLSLFVGDEDVRALDGLGTKLAADDVVVLITAIAGG